MEKRSLKELNEELIKLLDEDEAKCIDPTAMLEMATIATDKTMSHIIKNISTNPDSTRNWYNEEYFKIYDNTSVLRSKKLATIKYREPEYVIHYNSNWRLNSKEKKDLIKFF